MPKVAADNSPLLERAIFGYDGTNYRVVKVDSDGNLVAALKATQRLRAELSINGIVEYGLQNLSLAAGANNLDTDPVPAGEFWAIFNVGYYIVSGSVNYVAVTAEGLAAGIVLEENLTPTSGVWNTVSAQVYLQEADFLRCNVQNATLNDDLYFRVAGYKMVAP